MTVANDDKTICAICREDSVCDFVTRCGHNFHEKCLMKAIDCSYSRECPYCRQSISRSKFCEKYLFKTKNLNVKLKGEIISLLGSLNNIDMSSGNSMREYGRSEIKPFGTHVLEQLIKIGWDINSPTEGGPRLLEWICERDDLHRLNFMFELGLKLDNKPDLKNRVLKIAEEKSSVLVAGRINEYVMIIPSDDNGNSPLHIAVTSNNLNTVKDLIAKGSDVNARNNYGVKPLHLAALEANLDIVSYLIANGAIIDSHDLNGRNALYEACRSSKNNSIAVVKKLIEAGARTDFLDNDKNTLLHHALIGKKFEIAALLINLFPDINQLNSYNESCLHMAVSYGPKSLLAKLIEAGANVNLKDSVGQTALHKAVMTNSVEVVEFLLENGADVNAINNKNEYPILLALKRIPSLPFVKALVRHGADLSVKDQKGLSIVELALGSR